MIIHRLKLCEIYVLLIILFPFTTIFQNYISFSNIALLVIVVCSMITMVVGNRYMRKGYFVWLFVSVIIWIAALLNTSKEALKTNTNMAVYYIFMLIYFIVFLDNKERIRDVLIKNKKYIYWTTILYTLLLTVSIFLPSSYIQMKAGGWGDELYFVSYAGSPNRVGPACIYILVLMCFLTKEKYKHKKMLLLACPHIYTVAMGGSRTYFVLGLCVMLILYYYWIDDTRKFRLSLLPLALLVVVIVLKSNMMNKILATFQQVDNKVIFWQKLTNTRSIFWVRQLNLFKETSMLHHLIGNGINFTTYNYGLWAHSDFIEILCSYGYIGLLNYIAVMFFLIRTFVKKSDASTLIKGVGVFIWLFNAFFNFFYCYFCAMLSYPILLMTISSNLVHKEGINRFQLNTEETYSL